MLPVTQEEIRNPLLVPDQQQEEQQEEQQQSAEKTNLQRIFALPHIEKNKELAAGLIFFVLTMTFLPEHLEAWLANANDDDDKNCVEEIAVFVGWSVMTLAVAIYNQIEQQPYCRAALGVDEKSPQQAVEPFLKVFLPYLVVAMIATPIASQHIAPKKEQPSWGPLVETGAGALLGGGVALWGTLPGMIRGNNLNLDRLDQNKMISEERQHLIKILLAFNFPAIVLGLAEAFGANSDNSAWFAEVEKSSLYISSVGAMSVAVYDKWREHKNNLDEAEAGAKAEAKAEAASMV